MRLGHFLCAYADGQDWCSLCRFKILDSCKKTLFSPSTLYQFLNFLFFYFFCLTCGAMDMCVPVMCIVIGGDGVCVFVCRSALQAKRTGV